VVKNACTAWNSSALASGGPGGNNNDTKLYI
jgi:hypothetical protein